MAASNDRSPSTRGLEEIITEDGILCSIISLLPLREAVKTSVLSRRWRYLWTHIPKLVFDDANIFDSQSLLYPKQSRHDELCKENMEMTEKFIKSVNSVLDHRQGLGRLDHFEVGYLLRDHHWEHLDRWIQFAAASETKVLGLYLRSGLFNDNLYDFPFELLGLSFIEELSIACCSLNPPCKVDGLNHLKQLLLYAVDAGEEEINCLISNCPSLKTMKMLNSNLRSLRVAHVVSELEVLVVKDCNYLCEIEMNAEKLGLLEYKGVPVDFKFKQSLELYDATIYFKHVWDRGDLDFFFMRLASNLPHLRSLNFKITGILLEATELPEVSNSFAHLKNLNCIWNVVNEMSLLHLATVLNAASVLQVLSLHLTRATEEPSKKLSNLEEILSMRPRTHLKTIKITGFYFDQWQVDIAAHLLNTATELESMTIEKGGDFSLEIHQTVIQILRQQVPANTKFVIL